jgi:hypothetical protein
MDLPIRGFQGIVQRTVRNNVIIIKAYKFFIFNCTKGLGRVLARRSKNVEPSRHEIISFVFMNYGGSIASLCLINKYSCRHT